MAGGDRPVRADRVDGCCSVCYKRARRALSECGRLANVNNPPEHGPILRGMVGCRRALRFAEATEHYHRPRCSSVLHSSK
jgi:hypothetical protein